MKKLFKFMLAVCIAAVMTCAVIPAAAAQETESTPTSTLSIADDGEKAYDLVWKYKEEGGHLWKRRWNKTLDMWYDPAWILVY